MPRIRSYEAQQSAQVAIPGHAATGSDYGATAGIIEGGKALMSVGDTLNDVAQRQEVSAVHAKLAKADAELSLELDRASRTAAPGDATWQDKFTQRANDYLAGLGAEIGTRAGKLAWDEGSARLAASLTKTAGMFQGKLAGEKALQDYTALLDNYGGVLLRDPLRFQEVLAASEKALADPNGPYAVLPPLARQKLERDTKADLSRSAVRGQIARDPQAALEQLNGGVWQHLKDEAVFTLKREAEIAISARRTDAERARIEAERAEAAALDATRNKYTTMILAPKDGDVPLTATQIANDPALAGKGGAAVKEHLILLMERRAKENPSTDEKHYGPLFQKLWDRAHASDDDQTKLRDENELNGYLGNGLTVAGVVALRGEIQGRRTLEGNAEAEMRKGFVKFVESELTRTNALTGIRDPKGDFQLQRFMSFFIPEYQKQRQAGKSPTALLNPDSPDFLGKTVGSFKRSTTQIIQDLIEANGTGGGGGGTPKEYTSADQVRADYASGLLTRDAATKILRDKGWAR